MNLVLIQILTIFIILLVGLPIYIFYRNQMVKMDGLLTVSFKRIIKVIFINFLVNVMVCSYFYWVFFSMIESSVVIYLVSFIVLISIIFYGNGIYITSILLSSYIDQFKQKTKHDIARDFLHGPISHLMIYQSYFILILLFSLMAQEADSVVMDLLGSCSVILVGGAVGLVLFIMHLYNNTLKYQLVGIVLAMFGSMMLNFFSVKDINYWTLFLYGASSPFIFFSIVVLKYPSLGRKIKLKLG